MNAEAEAVGVGKRIDQIVDEVRFGAHQLAVFSAHGIDAIVAVSKHRGDFVRVEPRAIDHAARFDGFLGAFRAFTGISLDECYGDGIRARVEPHDARARQQACSLIRGHARERFDQVFGGDDAGRRHFQRGGGFDVRLAGAHRGAVHHAQTHDAVGAAVFGQMFELRFLFRVMSHHELAAIPVRHVVRGAEFVQHAVARHAQPRFQRAGRIVDARMDHAAVARARAHAQLGHLLDEKHVAPAPRNRARHGATHHAAADDDNVGAIHSEQDTDVGGRRLETEVRSWRLEAGGRAREIGPARH